MRTDRTVPDNTADIVIGDNKQGTRMSIDVAIPGDRNVIKKEAKKILKYKYLMIQGDSVARSPKLLSIKNYVVEIMT